MIREIKGREIDEVMDLWLKSTIEGHKFIPKEYWEINYDIVREVYIPKSKTYVYYEANMIKGFISVLNNNCIGALFVNPKDKGCGIGRALMTFVQDKSKSLTLGVYEKNTDALEFYKRMGFTKIGQELNEETEEVEIVMGWNK